MDQQYYAEVEQKEQERIEMDPLYRSRYELEQAIDKLERNALACRVFFRKHQEDK